MQDISDADHQLPVPIPGMIAIFVLTYTKYRKIRFALICGICKTKLTEGFLKVLGYHLGSRTDGVKHRNIYTVLGQSYTR